jgi:hypothetical protein
MEPAFDGVGDEAFGEEEEDDAKRDRPLLPAVSAAPSPAPMKSLSRAPPPGAMPPKAKRRAMPSGALGSGSGRGGGGEGGADEDAESLVSESNAPPEAWLDYGHLTLAGPFESSPGKLEQRPELSASPRLRTAVAEADSAAKRVAANPLPSMAVAVRAQRFDDRYDATHPVSVPQDGRWHTVTLFTADAAFTPELVSVPSLDPRVYRSLELKNRSRHAFLEGPADVTVGGMFLATVTLPAIAPGGVERVGLGVEEAVQVSRNVRYREETGGLLGGTALLIHEIDVEVVNRLSSPISITVRERVPVSDDREVTVEELTQTPPWKAVPVETPVRVNGAREWTVAVPAGARQALEAKLQIRIPSGRMLVGGNRRS